MNKIKILLLWYSAKVLYYTYMSKFLRKIHYYKNSERFIKKFQTAIDKLKSYLETYK